jgi:protein NUD1
MGSKVAPWLQGLDETWEDAPAAAHNANNNISLATHDADSIQSNQSRIPRRSLSGINSLLSSQKNSSNGTTQIKRSPLAPLSNSNANTFRRQHGSTRMGGIRSVSCSSGTSGEAYGTVQQRSKSASPTKKHETLEWKRRLVHGEVGYGDQTELFAPSGLENIFTKSRGQENDVPTSRNRLSWLAKSDAPMPSSPPPWPSSFMARPQTAKTVHTSLHQVEEDVETGSPLEGQEEDGSFRSNPFDLRDTNEPDDSSGMQERELASDPVSEHHWQRVGNRTISGQTELEQEDFSPVFISKHTTDNGQVDYAALDSRLVKQFQTVKVSLRHPSQEERDEQVDNSGPSVFTDGPESDPVAAPQDFSLSENLPTGTPPFVNIGRHVEIKRGGYSRLGSFNQRPLSPSPSKPDESLLPGEGMPEPSMLSVSQPLPTAPTPPHNGPLTPLRAATPNPPKSKSSGSPLKLFAAHDTFTNNRLLRRMSQLDPEALETGLSEIRGGTEDAHEAQRLDSSRAATERSFGSGKLNNFAFNAEITITSASDPDDALERSPGSEIPAPGSRIPLSFRLEMPSAATDTFKIKRKPSRQSVARSSKNSTLETPPKDTAHLQPTVEDASERSTCHEQMDAARTYEGGKRPPTSPYRNPTPKRRRTLQASELQIASVRLDHSFRGQSQEPYSNRKRKDARQGDIQNIAQPEVLASRKILRPRNPTPSQRRRQQIEDEIKEATEEFAAHEADQLDAVMEQIESSIAGIDGPPTIQQQAEAVATQVASFTLRVQKPSGEYRERKTSVTTQDFLNEAMTVMQLIRARARPPRSNLGSVEESDAEGQSAQQGSSLLDVSDPLRVSRPPSREGGHSGWRSGHQSQTDARVLSHLRKFQEKNDTEFIADSIASLQVDDDHSLEDNVVAVDRESNIRITRPPSTQPPDGQPDGSRPTTQGSQGSTNHTQHSAGTSTGRTIGTSSTRKSELVGNLPPDAVAHLIGQQVGGMTFDKEQQRWVRMKSPEKKEKSGFLEPPSNITSDDDPFREISDLPVDPQVEARRISSSGRTTVLAAENVQPSQCAEQGRNSADDRTASTETVLARPVTRDSSHLQGRFHHMHSSSVPSRYTAFTSSQQEKVETRATSWSDEELARMTAMGKARQQPLAYAAAQAALSLRGGRNSLHQEPIGEVTEETILSSPKPASEADELVVDSSLAEGLGDGLREDTMPGADESEIEDIRSPRLRQSQRQPFHAPSSTLRSRPHQMSLRKQTLTNCITNETHERSELSLVAALPGERMMSMSLSVSRPVTKYQESRVAELQSSPTKADPNATLLLSDLPDFTIHEEDTERPSERALSQRLAHHAAAEVSDRYALAVMDLVKVLTDVHEEEPYWEDLKQLDLHDQSLESLYGLDDFCTRVQDMDVSNNALTQLQGAPSTIRRLLARSNRLSSVTHWGHLMNLQFVDISDNHLDNLRGMANLIHLREIVADDNQITSLEGVSSLDGLLKLRLRRNKLQRLNLEGSQLQRLVEMDLSGNQVATVRYLEQLSALEQLNLDGNPLKGSFFLEHQQPALRSLSVRDCDLQHLDVATMPELRYLATDNNRLSSIPGIERLAHLDTLSMRRQKLPDGIRIKIFEQAVDARRILLSGNAITTINLTRNFLNLQHLELASVGLQLLPDDFGLHVPNVRILNLNFNSVKDLRPLLNIQRLEQLFVCGNRIDRLRKTVATLAKVTSLQSLDIRDNPVTQCFYPPAVTAQTGVAMREGARVPEDEDAYREEMEKAKHCLPAGNAAEDKAHSARLDDDTKLRRRVYELLLAHSCPSLQQLDGLGFAKEKASVKDHIWDRLVELGVVRKSQAQVH